MIAAAPPLLLLLLRRPIVAAMQFRASVESTVAVDAAAPVCGSGCVTNAARAAAHAVHKTAVRSASRLSEGIVAED